MQEPVNVLTVLKKQRKLLVLALEEVDLAIKKLDKKVVGKVETNQNKVKELVFVEILTAKNPITANQIRKNLEDEYDINYGRVAGALKKLLKTGAIVKKKELGSQPEYILSEAQLNALKSTKKTINT
jgi:hypothetical protein